METETALADISQQWSDEDEEDFVEGMESTEVLHSLDDTLAAPQPEADTVSESVLETAASAEVETEPEGFEGEVEASPSMEEHCDAQSVVIHVSEEAKTLDEDTEEKPATDDVLAVQAEAHAFVEEVTSLSVEVPISSDETVVSELQETPEVEASPEVFIPSDNTSDSESAEAPVIQDEASKAKTETTPEVAASTETPIASAAQAEYFEPGEVTLAPFSEDSATCEASGLSETALLSEATVLDEDAALMEAEAPEEPLEPSEATASCETAAASEYDTVAPDEFALPDESSALAESPVNLEATEPAVDTETAVEATPELPPSFPVTETQDDIQSSDEEETEQSATSGETAQPAETTCFTEPSSAPAPEAEHTAAELDQVEEALASPLKASEISSEVDPEALAETMSSESMAESAAAPGEAPEVESLPADFSTVSIFR